MPRFGRGRPIQPRATGAMRATATGGVIHDASVAFAGVGSFAAAGQLVQHAAVAFAGAGTLAATAQLLRNASLAFTCVGTFDAAAGMRLAGSVAFNGVGTFAATPEGGDAPVTPVAPPGMPGGRIIPWDRMPSVPQPRARGKTLADAKRELAKQFGPKSKKKKRTPEPPPEPPLAPVPVAVEPPAPPPTADRQAGGLVELLEAINPAARKMAPQAIRLPEFEEPAPVWDEPALVDQMAAAQFEDEEMLMLLALVTTLEDE